MANKPLALNPGRQYPLVASQAFTFENLSEAAVAVVLAKLPRGALILSGSLNVTTAFGAGATIKLGFAGADTAHGTIDVATVGIKPITLTGVASDKTALIGTPGGAYTAGAATLHLTYIIGDRANEVQP